MWGTAVQFWVTKGLGQGIERRHENWYTTKGTEVVGNRTAELHEGRGGITRERGNGVVVVELLAERNDKSVGREKRQVHVLCIPLCAKGGRRGLLHRTGVVNGRRGSEGVCTR